MADKRSKKKIVTSIRANYNLMSLIYYQKHCYYPFLWWLCISNSVINQSRNSWLKTLNSKLESSIFSCVICLCQIKKLHKKSLAAKMYISFKYVEGCATTRSLTFITIICVNLFFQMWSIPSLSVIILVSCVHLIYGQLPDISRSYDTDTTHLDFVYHNHDEMTNYLR